MKNITIYTDGACSYNPGPGGWGAVLIYKNTKKEMSGFCLETTNNRMEMQAVISALKELKEPCNVDLYTDSAYVHNAFAQDWISSWLKNGWKTANRKPVLNDDLWKILIELSKIHHITWHKVKGHADDFYNNRCDALAREQVDTNYFDAKKND